MNKRIAYEEGVNNGYEIARSNACEGEYQLTTEEGREKFISDMHEIESDHFRQFTPFEFFASDVNKCGDRAEGLWDEYDRGVGVGIRKVLREYLKNVLENMQDSGEE
jgi:hypothetical protein